MSWASETRTKRRTGSTSAGFERIHLPDVEEREECHARSHDHCDTRPDLNHGATPVPAQFVKSPSGSCLLRSQPQEIFSPGAC